ncbi:MAG: hypothetical protein P1U77_14110, partial [Rubripirellula sp.]|nr:hypothetical protein [Rubripirellula sp.]
QNRTEQNRTEQNRTEQNRTGWPGNVVCFTRIKAMMFHQLAINWQRRVDRSEWIAASGSQRVDRNETSK